MIISASRRTDIPANYSQWFMNRLLEKEILVPNPYNRKKVNRIQLSPQVVDCIVFFTKNPEPMLPYLSKIERLGYPFYFEMTITDYGEDIEPNVPSMEDSMASFVLLSEKIGKERVDARFDPILLNDTYTIDYHVEKFEMLCEWLHRHTTRCILSFVDTYKNSPFLELEREDMLEIASRFSKIGKKYDLPIYTCAEEIELKEYGILHGACIDKKKIEQIVGYKLDVKKDASQRKKCLCCESIDIGMYDTCKNGCQYCYAISHTQNREKKWMFHDVESPLLTGQLQGDEIITEKEVRTLKDLQLSLFDFI